MELVDLEAARMEALAALGEIAKDQLRNGDQRDFATQQSITLRSCFPQRIIKLMAAVARHLVPEKRGCSELSALIRGTAAAIGRHSNPQTN
jgi:hypothetical protein